MSSRSKQRTEQHLIDQDAQAIFRAAVPRHWVVREYRPDYGIDFDVEVFRASMTESTNPKKQKKFETLGEHVFVQLKGCSVTKRQIVKLHARGNVEKSKLTSTSEPVGEMEVVAFPLEVSELVTVQRMGSALPVLLVVADLDANKCFFVCLNDYIDKILVPQHEDYTTTDHRTIHVPVRNLLCDPVVGTSAFRWYAKRAKLYAAFQKFVYQSVELGHAYATVDFEKMARHFASLLLQYDFWHDTEMWELIPYYGAAVERFLETGDTGLFQINVDGLRIAAGGDTEREDVIKIQLRRQYILELWRLLAVLPRNYEEVCREWFLPTSLGFLSSYPYETPSGP